MKKVCLLTLVIALTGCSIQPPAPSSADQSITLEYTNPVWEGYLADPFVLCTNGTYYAYGTGLREGKRFPILKSKDLQSWKFIGGALEPVQPALKDYWAPEVAERDGTYYLYYAGDTKMRVAISDSPEGPFKDVGTLLFPDMKFSIDGHPFKDPVSGKWYLFFAMNFYETYRRGTGLAVVELGDDMISVKGEVHTVIRAFDDWQKWNRKSEGPDAWHTVEGASVIYRGGKYYCFYSGGSWMTPGYGVGCAVSDTITGPYTDPWSQGTASVLSSIGDELVGPGHNSIIPGPDKKTYFIIYHSWNQHRTARQMCLDPIVWTENGPKAYQPSRGKKKVTLPLTGSD